MPKANIKFVAATIAMLALSACSLIPQPPHYVDVATPNYDMAASARMRVLSANGPERSASFWSGNCYRFGPDSEAVRVNDGFLAAWKNSSRSIVIGMPPSPRESMRVEGLVHKDLIREYVVPAGRPVTLLLGMSNDGGKYGVTRSCYAPAVTFTPLAGQDYDIFLDMSGGRCRTSVRHIDSHGMDDPVRLEAAPRCQTGSAVAE